MRDQVNKFRAHNENKSNNLTNDSNVEPNVLSSEKLPPISIAHELAAPKFSARVSLRKSEGLLEVQSIQVIIKNPQGNHTAAFVFDAPIDHEGALALDKLIRSAVRPDNSILHHLLSITQSHSCGEWRSYSLLSNDSDRSIGKHLIPVLPSFAEVATDRSPMLRVFTCATIAIAESVAMEGEIAEWGESLQIRIIENSTNENKIHRCLKILLPEDTTRTEERSHVELVTLLNELSDVFYRDGEAGLLATLQNSALEVLHYPFTNRGAASPKVPPHLIPRANYRGEHVIPSSGVVVSYFINAESATISITSSHKNVDSGVKLSFETHGRFPQLTAAQIREIRDLHHALATRSRLVSENSASNIFTRRHKFETVSEMLGLPDRSLKSTDTPGTDSLSYLKVAMSASMVKPEYFLSTDGAWRVFQNRRCSIANDLTLDMETIQDICNGARHMVVRLPESVAKQTPDILHELVFIEYPNDTLRARVRNSMEGSHTFTIDGQYLELETTRAKTLGDLCDIFARQELDGWGPVLTFLQFISDRHDSNMKLGGWDPNNQHLPLPQEPIGIQNFAVAGQVLRFINRGSIAGIQGRCSHLGGSTTTLGLREKLFDGVLELRFVDSQLVQIDVRQLEPTSEDTVPWKTIASFVHPGLSLDPGAMHKTITALRTFFQNQMRVSISRWGYPEAMATQQLGEDLKALSFSSQK